MEIYTIGFTKKPAIEFFEKLKQAGIKRVLDVRLKNTSQLSGFAKRGDLEYFLEKICGAEYLHEPLLAPTDDLMKAYKKKKLTWHEYEKQFLALMAEREIEKKIDPEIFTAPTALLCSEGSPEFCHRRLALEYLNAKWKNVVIIHL